jgi:endoglucanase
MNVLLRKFTLVVFIITITPTLWASKLKYLSILDNQYIMVHFQDGEVIRRDDGTGNCAFMGHCHAPDGSKAIRFGSPLDMEKVLLENTWVIKSSDDRNYRRKGKSPLKVYRKSKLNGMSISHWDADKKDYVYDHTMEHFIYLELPYPLQQGKTYTAEIKENINSDISNQSFTFDIFNSVSESIHINLVGYSNIQAIKNADLYHWMGNGGNRDYSKYEGNSVFLINTETEEKTLAGEIKFWKNEASEANGYNLTGSDVWNIDFTGDFAEGSYKLAVEGIGCSQPFNISSTVFFEPYWLSTLGFFYMRLGQDSPEINPRPRLPLFIPGLDETTVPITNLHPYHEAWKEIRTRKTDPWDHPVEFESYTTGEFNNNAWGGHSDAYDWDKRLQHVSIIYDMLLPFILAKGVINDDDLGIAESNNGIPDLLDEVKYEVDSWLRLRSGKGYAHGITCPYNEEKRIRYQGGNTAIAAWANALNASMLAEAFRISGHNSLMIEYADSAKAAFHYADQLEDPMLNFSEGDGTGKIRGRDFKMMAAAYLYNLTADTQYEDIMAQECVLNTENLLIVDTDQQNQLYGIAAYLTTDKPINYPDLQQKMKAAIIAEAKLMEAGYINERPSRRATCNDAGYFWTIQNMQRTILAHAISDDAAEKDLFLKALLLEADWSLGRNPANIIQMTTASTPLETKRSVMFAYTSGYNDGVPGLHPGHTPYWNMNDWNPAMIMGRPSWLASHGFPEKEKWPVAELFFNTDYVWAHTEFTPQQTLRGKFALYAYLHSLSIISNK